VDKWIRRRLRAIAWKQWKRGRKRRYKELRRRGVDHDLAARTAGSGHGLWRMALTPPCILPCPTLSSPPSACLPLWSGPHNPMNRRVRDPHARWWGERGAARLLPIPILRGAETKAWMRGSSPRKTTWGDMRIDKPLLLQGRFLRTALRERGRVRAGLGG